MLVSVVFLYPLLLGIRYWKETFVAGMPEMVEVVKNQDKHGTGHVLFGYAGSTSPFHITLFELYSPFQYMHISKTPPL